MFNFDLTDELKIKIRKLLKKDKKGSYVYTGSDKKKVKQYIDYSEEVDGKYIITDGLTENTVIYD